MNFSCDNYPNVFDPRTSPDPPEGRIENAGRSKFWAKCSLDHRHTHKGEVRNIRDDLQNLAILLDFPSLGHVG